MFTVNYGDHNGAGGCVEFEDYADAVAFYFDVAGEADFSEIYDSEGFVVLTTVG